jgi:glycosyltransferase involved in cell wall biosynthesis
MLHGRGIPDRFIDTVYNGTDLLDVPHTDPRITKDSLGIDQDKKVVSIIGRICREKGHVEMIRAMREVTEQHQDAHLMFVGRVVPGFEKELESELTNAKLHQRVTLTGERQDIPALLDAVSISAMPSYIETFGVAAVEAMARSKPVVASRVGGLPEVVKDGHTGILVDLEPGDIAKAVSYLLKNDNEREAMGVRARKTVEERFTTHRMVDRFETIYAKAARS